MKKAKIMLIAIAVLATVGGALAFKANKKFSEIYCIGTTISNPDQALTRTTLSKPTTGAGFTYYYTTLKANGQHVVVFSDCPETTTFSTKLTAE